MGKIIAVYNQKGGVGKTTTTVNLAASVGALGKKVLIVDIDPQGNTTSGLGVDKRAVAHSTYDLLLGSFTAEDALVTLPFKNLSILPADVQLTGIEIELVNVPRRESRLKAALVPMRDAFDYIFIDCPPSLGILALNTLCAADTVIIPIQCEYYALEGLTQLMTTLRKVQLQFNPTLDLEGVLLTMYDSRLKLTQQVAEEVQKYFPNRVFRSVIPRVVRLSEAPSFGKPILYYDTRSNGSIAYVNLAKELVQNQKKRGG